ncbi:MAG: DUF1707 SHOCT-like domain-containing protein [Acidimicrobiales bacterium]
MPSSPEPERLSIRISDADRELVVKTLSKNAAEGRLTLEELEERLGAVYSAKTYGELEPLLSDLPGTAPDISSPTARVGRPRAGRALWHGPSWSRYVRVNVLCWAIWGVSVITSWPAGGAHAHLSTMASMGHMEGLWPLWVTVPWGVVRLSSRRRADGPQDRAPEQLERSRPLERLGLAPDMGPYRARLHRPRFHWRRAT